MKIDILAIPPKGLHLKIEEEGSKLQAIAGEVDYSILSPVSANLTLLQSGGEVFVQGDMVSTVKVQCSRCLREFEYKVSSRIDVVYKIALGHEVSEKELSEGDISTNYIEGAEIDTDRVLLEQLSLDLPIQHVCRVDCKGLCPKCGADLNQGKCSCNLEEHRDPRLAKLKELKLQ